MNSLNVFTTANESIPPWGISRPRNMNCIGKQNTALELEKNTCLILPNRYPLNLLWTKPVAVYRKDVKDLFERKEKFSRDRGDLKTLNQIKKEKDAFLENGRDPTLFFIMDQKRFLEQAKLDLIKAYEKTIKDCLNMKLDVKAEDFSKELEEIRKGKIKSGISINIKPEPKKIIELNG